MTEGREDEAKMRLLRAALIGKSNKFNLLYDIKFSLEHDILFFFTTSFLLRRNGTYSESSCLIDIVENFAN